MKKTVSRVIWIVVILLILILLYSVLDFMLTEDMYSMSRRTIYDFYTRGPVDTLFVGPSHSIYCIDAPQLSEDLNTSVFSLSTSSLDFVQMYSLLGEAFRVKKIDNVYINISPSRFFLTESIDTATYLITDYLRSPIARVKMITSTVPPESYMNGFFRLRRTIKTVPTLDEIKWIVEEKLSDNYNAVCTDSYSGRGYWPEHDSLAKYGTPVINRDSAFFDDSDDNPVQMKQIEYLRKCIEFCISRNASVHLYVPPFSQVYLMNFSEYNTVMDIIKQICSEYGIPLCDMNLVKKEYLDLNISDFFNPDHVNAEGSKKIEQFLVNYIKDPSKDYFTADYKDNYLKDGSILAFGYTKTILDENGAVIENVEETEPVYMRIDISSYIPTDFPIEIQLRHTDYDVETESWTDGSVITPDASDDASASFVLPYDEPYDDYETFYLVDMLDTNTKTVLCESRSSFEMK